MGKGSNSRRQAFSEVVSIDAWHGPFDNGNRKAALHADVVFGTARVGGEENSKVRFRLSVKAVEVIVVISDAEPVSVDKASVRREPAVIKAKGTAEQEKSFEISGESELNLGVGRAERNSFTGNITGKMKKILREKENKTYEILNINVVQSKTIDGFYCWKVNGRDGKALDGRPWDAVSEPRLTLVDKRSSSEMSLPPAIRLEVRCLREDLIIKDIEVKDGTVRQSILSSPNKKAAAESYIRDRLMEEGLEVASVSEKFGSLTLAAVFADVD